MQLNDSTLFRQQAFI
ncbi:hypothetical protein SEEE1831_11412, partial [Salmonella enterica subsp. enterica serovar Enteritidis str. 13183-1]